MIMSGHRAATPWAVCLGRTRQSLWGLFGSGEGYLFLGWKLEANQDLQTMMLYLNSRGTRKSVMLGNN